jgi:hypothetical protein
MGETEVPRRRRHPRQPESLVSPKGVVVNVE